MLSASAYALSASLTRSSTISCFLRCSMSMTFHWFVICKIYSMACQQIAQYLLLRYKSYRYWTYRGNFAHWMTQYILNKHWNYKFNLIFEFLYYTLLEDYYDDFSFDYLKMVFNLYKCQIKNIIILCIFLLLIKFTINSKYYKHI